MGTQIEYTFDCNSGVSYGLDCVMDESNPDTTSTAPLVLRKSSGSDECRIFMRPSTGSSWVAASNTHRVVNSITLNLNVTANSSTVDSTINIQAVKQNTSGGCDIHPYELLTWNEYSTPVHRSWSTAGAKDTTDDLYESGKDYGLGPVMNRRNIIATTVTSGIVSLSIDPRMWEEYFIANHENYGFILSTDVEGVSITFDGSTGGGTAPTMVVDYSPPLNTYGSGDDRFDISYKGIYSVKFDTKIYGEGSGAETRFAKYSTPVRVFSLEAVSMYKTTDDKGSAEFLYDFFIARQGRLEPFYVYSPFHGEWVRVRFDSDILDIEQFEYNLYNSDIKLIEDPLL